jgi:hypothetical protein
MAIVRSASNAINRTLANFGLRLTRISTDFEQYPLNESIQKCFFRDLAACADGWLKNQVCFVPVGFDTEATVKEFFFAYLESPFRVVTAGSRFNNLLWLVLLARAFKPTLIIDSGTYQGASSWALSFGAPEAEVCSFDIDQSQIKHRTPGVQYFKQDWSKFDFGSRLGPRTLAYFDDHVNQGGRLLESYERGIELAVFDDDIPIIPAFRQISIYGTPFPLIEFVLNDDLRREKEIVLKSAARTWQWPVDTLYLDRVRSVIAAADRVPNTSLISGIHQTPYRVVKIKPRTEDKVA